LRYTILGLTVQDAVGMKKRVEPDDVQTPENLKLSWEIRRGIQQNILEKKLVQCFLRSEEGSAILERYPAAMQPLIRDFMRKAEEKAKLSIK